MYCTYTHTYKRCPIWSSRWLQQDLPERCVLMQFMKKAINGGTIVQDLIGAKTVPTSIQDATKENYHET
jgi:hypothetical protein